MRTAGQGQAAVPRERVRRRRLNGLPGLCDLGRGRRSPGLSRVVERYQFAAKLVGGGFCPYWALPQGASLFLFLRCHLQRNALPARSERTGRDNKERIS